MPPVHAVRGSRAAPTSSWVALTTGLRCDFLLLVDLEINYVLENCHQEL